MLVLVVFGFYFVVLGAATARLRSFHLPPVLPHPITGRGALIAGETHILTGLIVALAAGVANPLPLIGVSAVVFFAGICAALTCHQGIWT